MTLIIKYIAKIDVTTGEVENISTVMGGTLPEEGIISGTDPAKQIIYIPSEGWENYEHLEIYEQFWWNGEDWVNRGVKPSQYHVWNIVTKKWEQDWDFFLSRLRHERNSRLSYCDWTQAPDTALHSSVVDAWRAYRDSLRNLPEVYKNPDLEITDLEHVQWPTPPDGSILEVTVW